jgi:hypothetical protein
MEEIGKNKDRKKFGNITETMERVCFVISVAGLDRHNMGRDGGDCDYDYDCNSST